MAEQEELYLTVKDVAHRLSVSTDTIYRWKREGTFPKVYRLSRGTARFKLSEIVEWESTRHAYMVTDIDMDLLCPSALQRLKLG